MAPPMIEPLRKNRFSLILESDDGESIEPYKISGFNIENFNDKKAITITAILLIGDWIEKFKKMNTVKIFFLDPTGAVIESLDYDIMYEGFIMDGTYHSDALLTSTFKYLLLE